jgi:hypothetical protein
MTSVTGWNDTFSPRVGASGSRAGLENDSPGAIWPQGPQRTTPHGSPIRGQNYAVMAAFLNLMKN